MDFVIIGFKIVNHSKKNILFFKDFKHIEKHLKSETKPHSPKSKLILS